jgi:signal transduction histidine kinase
VGPSGYDDWARRRLALLAQVSERFAGAGLDVDRVLEVVCRTIAETIRDACAVSLLADDGETLGRTHICHVDPDAEASVRTTMSRVPPKVGDGSALGRVAASRQPLFQPVVPPEVMRHAEPAYRAHLERYPFDSLIVVPLLRADRLLGTMTVSRAGKPYDEDDLLLVGQLADRAASAIAHARLLEQERAAVQVRDDFLAIAGHELRTPLTALQLQLDVMRQHPGGDPVQAARIERAVRSAGKLAELVDEMLDVSRLTTGRLTLHPEPLDLAEVVTAVCVKLEPSATRAGCLLRAHVPEEVRGSWDRLRIEQVVGNLLSNAIKYGAGKPVEVTVRGADDVASIVVRDQGIGIDDADRRRIFGRFERAVSDRHYGGFGLGLWITRQIVEASGGTVEVESTPGKGATFTVVLPRAAQ